MLPPSSASPSTSFDHSDGNYNACSIILITASLSVATVIGSGILAMPVTLHHTSLQNFLIVFTLAFAAHVAAIYTTVELFQRTTLYMQQNPSYFDRRAPSTSSDTLALIPSSNPAHQATVKKMTLFTIADLYLQSRALNWLFHICTFLSFLSLLTSYGLAGPQALWQILHPPPTSSFPPLSLFFWFCVIGVIAVVFFTNVLLPVFSSLTVLKGALFIGVVIIVAALPPSTHVVSLYDLFFTGSSVQSALESFLVATVALGGLPNTMPVMYALLPERPTRQQISHFRQSVLAGLTICYLLNIGWVIAITFVVPRDGPSSLTTAYNLGQISTIPLVETLSSSAEVSSLTIQAVTVVVQTFILVSTCVSFFIIAAGYKSYATGVADAAHSSLQEIGWYAPHRFTRGLVYTIMFGAVVCVVILNPNGFITILTRLTSLTMNLQAGLLLFLMLYFSRIRIGAQQSFESRDDIILPMSKGASGIASIVGTSVCGFACFWATTLIFPLN